MTIQIDGSLINIVLPQEQLDKGRLSWASLPNQAKGLPLVQGEMNISQSILILKGNAVNRIF